MIGRSYSNGDPSVTYTYDQTACVVVSTCYNIGRRTGMTDADGSESWAYDTMGREWGEQRTTNSITKTTAYTYDFAGDLATLTYPSGRTVTYSTDSAGRPSSAKDVANNITYIMGPCLNGISNIGVCYAPQGAVSGDSFGPDTGNYITHEESYNNRLQPNRTNVFVQGGATLMSLSYGFVDASAHNNGNVMSITNSVDATRSQSFAYDQLNRLVTAETTSTYATSPAHCWGEAYIYDNSATTPGEFGNITNINVASTSYNGCAQESLSIVSSAANQITSFSYDASGNVLNDTHNSYAWNAESEIKTAAGVNYTYDGDGDRVQKSNGKIYWYGAGTEILDESDASGNITDEYVFFGGQRAAHRVVSTNQSTITTRTCLAARDQIYTSAGVVCYDADFYPFGGERAYTNTCTQNYKFEGKERDTETNNDDFGAGYYSSAFGRWTSPDWSAIPAPVPYANLTNPQTLNLYAMVSDNPETFADLNGHNFAAPGEYGGNVSLTGPGDFGNPTSLLVGASDVSTNIDDFAADYYAQEEERKAQDQEKKKQQQDPPAQNGGLKPPPPGKPPIPLPPGKDGKPNSWEQVPGTQDKQYGPSWKPKDPVDGKRQPKAWWDPKDGYWSHEPANGGAREHFDRWGNRINMQQATKAVITMGIGAMIIRGLVIAGELVGGAL